MKLVFPFIFLILIGCTRHKTATREEPEQATLAGEKLSGFDMLGRKDLCDQPPKDMICTTSYEPGDMFAAACVEGGFKAMKCNCHSYLCSENLVVRNREKYPELCGGFAGISCTSGKKCVTEPWLTKSTADFQGYCVPLEK